MTVSTASNLGLTPTKPLDTGLRGVKCDDGGFYAPPGATLAQGLSIRTPGAGIDAKRQDETLDCLLKGVRAVQDMLGAPTHCASDGIVSRRVRQRLVSSLPIPPYLSRPCRNESTQKEKCTP
jgi:hypothetical protein